MILRGLRKKWFGGKWFRSPAFKVLLSAFLFIFIAVSGITLYYYRHYSDIIDRRLDGEVFQLTARLYAAPYRIYVGQKLKLEAVVARLQRAGFEPKGSTHEGDGTYEAGKGRLIITPNTGEGLRLTFDNSGLSAIMRTKSGPTSEALLPPELVTSLSDTNREKRRIVDFNELPPVLVNALIAAEDNRFYTHHGIDPIRLAGAVFQSLRNSNRVRGTSTITQQLSRNFFLTTERTLVRKANEIFISLLLEQRLTKQEILTLYANDVYLGARGSFSIKGFGEGAVAYFDKDLTALTLPEAATLAAIIPAPSGAYSLTRRPDRAKERRNLVLNNMAELGFITPDEAKTAAETELKLAKLRVDDSDAPYLVDFIHKSLLRDYSEDALNNDGLRVETTIVPDLQNAAVAALTAGLKDVNDIVAQRNKNRKPDKQLPNAQAAIIVLDAPTGGILAMAGGGDYGESQLNRVTQAFRQPGSIFKPLVYAAAFEQCDQMLYAPSPEATENAQVGLEFPELGQITSPLNADECITPVTPVDDVETIFTYDEDKTYEPNNYHAKYNGVVTVRYALEHSLNVPTIKIAEAIGFDKVADLARRAGLNAKIKGYPSVALGAFEVTPLEMAGAYTMFANQGKRFEPHALKRVIGVDGSVKAYKYPSTQVLSPRVAYLMTNIMEGVINHGTGVGVRSRGFSLPAAGKTGTSRDGWFAGYTKDYVVIAWVGFDDNSDLNIEGAHSALPIWAAFMLKAQELYPPRDINTMSFQPPEGIIEAFVSRDSSENPIIGCEMDYTESFIAGSVEFPVECRKRKNPVTTILEKIKNAVNLKNLFNLFGKDNEPPATPPSDTR